MTPILAAIAIVLVGTIANLWWRGTIAEEQAEEAHRLANEWRQLELARTGTCQTLLECMSRLTVIENLRSHNNFLTSRARTTDQPPRAMP